MAAYKGRSRRIKDALVALLQEITYDNGAGDEPAFVSVLDNTKDAFDGYPAVRVLPDNLTPEPGAMAQSDHTMAFAVILHLPLEDPTNVESATYNQMYDLTDLIVDNLESDDYANALNEIDPTLGDWLMSVKQSTWTVATGKAGGMLLMNIPVEVNYSRNLN